MQFIDLSRQQLLIRDKIEMRIKRVLDSGKYIMGPEIVELEEKLAEYVGVSHCITCSSGTDALLMPLMAQGIGPGDAVITTPFTFIATAEVASCSRLMTNDAIFVIGRHVASHAGCPDITCVSTERRKINDRPFGKHRKRSPLDLGSNFLDETPSDV